MNDFENLLLDPILTWNYELSFQWLLKQWSPCSNSSHPFLHLSLLDLSVVFDLVDHSNLKISALLGFFLFVQSLSCVRLFVIPWTAALQAPLSSTVSWSLFKFMSIELVMIFNCLILCHPLLLLPSILLNITTFTNELSLCIRWPKYWNFHFSISPSSEYSGLISFRMDWLDLLAVQGTLKILLQHHSSKASVLPMNIQD